MQEVSSEKETVPEKEETSAQESASEEEGTGTVEETSKEDSTDENVENGTTEHESSEITSTETETTEETTDEEITEGTTEETTEELTEEETTEEELVTEPSEEVLFNTGKCVYSVVGRKDFFDYNLGGMSALRRMEVIQLISLKKIRFSHMKYSLPTMVRKQINGSCLLMTVWR